LQFGFISTLGLWPVALDRVFRKLCTATYLSPDYSQWLWIVPSGNFSLHEVTLRYVFRKLLHRYVSRCYVFRKPCIATLLSCITSSGLGSCIFRKLSTAGLKLVMLDYVSSESCNSFIFKFGLQPISGGLWVFRKLNSYVSQRLLSHGYAT
jgi:hypothetical protein